MSDIGIKSNEAKWPAGWSVQGPWLSLKAGNPPLFQRKEKLMSMPNDQHLWVEALCTSPKPFIFVWFSNGNRHCVRYELLSCCKFMQLNHSMMLYWQNSNCKSHVWRSFVERQTTDSLFSVSKLKYRHSISAGSKQKTCCTWYGDAPMENLTPGIHMERLQCSVTRETSIRQKLPHALLSVKMSDFKRNNSVVASVSFYVPCQNSRSKPNRRDALWCRHFYPQTEMWSGIGNRFHCLLNWIRY